MGLILTGACRGRNRLLVVAAAAGRLLAHPERRGQIPAVTHVDGAGRLQTVDPAGNSRYHALIEAFFRLTGVPMVLNTSFNENEPVVCRPEEALDCFLRTKMDLLILGNHVVSRTAPSAP